VVTATASGVVTPTSFLLSNLLWYVAPTGNDSNNCQSPTTTCATINGVLNKLDFMAGDTIRVATGTYTGTGSEVVLLNKNATLSGGWSNDFIAQNSTSVIDGQTSRQGIAVRSGIAAIIERFTVQGGTIGIYNYGTLTLGNSIISNNAGSGIPITLAY
jgi:hypothetical protein